MPKVSIEGAMRDLLDVLATGSDAEIDAALVKLDQLRRHTAGLDREMVIDAIQECRRLKTPAGQLRRAVALAVHQS